MTCEASWGLAWSRGDNGQIPALHVLMSSQRRGTILIKTRPVIETLRHRGPMSGDWSSHPNVPLEIRGRGMQPVSLPGENNKNHVSLQECPLTETICLGCIMLAGDTGCPPGSGLVHMKYLAVVTWARCDFIGHVPSLPSWPAQYSDCHLSSSLTLGLCLYSLSPSQARVFILTS